MPKKGVNNIDLDKLIAYLKTVPIINRTPIEYRYTNSVIICLDAVLSINRDYDTLVSRCLDYFKRFYPDVKTLQELLNLITKHGYAGFQQVWKYNHPQRVRVLEDLVKKFIEYGQGIGETDDLKAMRHWAESASIENFNEFGVKGVGINTYQYLRILSGVSAARSDVNTRLGISQALNKDIKDPYVIIELMECASQRMNIPTNILGHSLWQYIHNQNDNL